MPTYAYECESCQHSFEEFQSMSSKPLRKCPACGKPKLVRLIGPGAGIIFKGSGFYETDYRSASYRKAKEADKDAPSGDSGSPGSSATGSGGAGSSDSAAASDTKKKGPNKSEATD
ncbi:MAG: zinc ribbon domain-containing protein [Planctomycetes bacterium]|nr:zinc ribbon domain-containing protein [Planctomycetota bacterium]MCB9888554.1 zinc ribbon domain-containing protein [Planctomycetota bacterium]